MKLVVRIFIVCFGFSPAAWCAESAAPAVVLPELVVTATRGETPIEQVGSSVTVISEEEVRRSQKTSVAEVLRMVPGVDIVRTGGAGQQVSVFVRGTNSNHTLVLIDGIEATDPANPTNQFDFASLQVDDIERIEVVRGPQSTLYGSDAIGGVIQIFTKRGAGARSRAQVEAGSFSTYSARGGLHGGRQEFNFGLTYSTQDTDGISVADSGSEDDHYHNNTVQAYAAGTPTPQTTLGLTVRHVDSETETDDAFALADDTDSSLDDTMWFSRLQGGLNLLEDDWKQTLGISHTRYDRRRENGPAPANILVARQRFKGRKDKIDWVHKVQLHPDHLLTAGVETEQEEADLSNGASPDAGTNALFFQEQAKLGEGVFATAGVRHDKHDDFGGVTTYQLTPVYVIRTTGTRLKGAYGTGFKAPSLSALNEDFPNPTCDGFGFDCSFFSNSNLEPERSKGWEIGFEQALDGDRFAFGATYFREKIRDLIVVSPLGTCDFADPVPDCSSTLDNLSRARSKGYELTTRYAPVTDLSFTASYTHTKAIDKATGDDLLRRPRSKASLVVDWQAIPVLGINLAGRYIGKRDDTDFSTFTPVTLESYTVFDLALTYALTSRWSLLGRVENAFDENYEEVFALGTPGRAWYGGLRYAP